MKGPEEKEHGAGCSAEWLVDQSRDSVSKGDLYGAKSWLLTAKSLYPKAFAVQVCFCCCCSSNVVSSSTTFAQGCQVRDFIPRSREYSGLLGFFSGIFFGEKISGKFSGFLENR